MYERLKEVDPEYADTVHANNQKRVIRALEYYQQTGQKFSLHNEEQRENESPYNFAYFVLSDERERLYKRIEQRIDIMLEEGLADEVKGLLDRGYTRNLVSMQGLGYKEIAAYLEGEITLDEAVYILKRDTRHFAKRQLTWFRREKEVTFIDKAKANYNDKVILEEMLQVLNEKGIV